MLELLILLLQRLFELLAHSIATFLGKTPVEQLTLVNSKDIVELCLLRGFQIQQHIVTTKDGYLLTVHRLYKDQLPRTNRPIVYLHHGLLTNSELFVLGSTADRCLPFLLFEQGYDVWLGNNRGNKYGRKHLVLDPRDDNFWNYSLDEFSLYDIPDTIDYILKYTDSASLNYIGFSQGSSQGISALSLNHSLNQKINTFIGLSPTIIPQKLNHKFILNLFVQYHAWLLPKLCGTKAIFASTIVLLQKAVGPNIYKRIVDTSLKSLFHWNLQNISLEQRDVGYPHVFSPSSVKSITHWLQIMKNAQFEMFDEGEFSKLITLSSSNHKLYKPHLFPLQTIKLCKLFLFYGNCDNLISIEPVKTIFKDIVPLENFIELDTYEHMDTLWATDVETKVFKPILSILEQNNIQSQKDLSNGSEITLKD